QKHLYNQMQSHMTPELSKQFSEVLVALKKAVVAIHAGVHHQEK
ncbi:TPA: mobilization protein, partial [Escherichia coli]|nr:mobilization protein [Escherichia coli]